MKYTLYLLFICIVSLLGCQKIEDVEKPDKLLNKSEMKGLIYDMVLLDASYGINEKKFKDMSLDMLEFISTKYQLDSTQIKLNIEYYNINFDDNLEIYEAVKDSLERLDRLYIDRAKEIDSLKKLKRIKKDSIAKLDTLSPKKILKVLSKT
ncbi:hypothetical protein P700755_001048 [Psychroflexus torquis ATCC 700755]|uniref:DUF4296 domain-containing protein n=1 Tax=Psychroflexus torquis (strain ATCC 700755 / CIP 106069 / ACAM 623) TaxID=313595 RepID=K4IDV3_PSYTT|nr:DUF4296 domain-containing protein [Psychroflexus torquis]AFU68018.1 hypothetical protein P700755_001048 [Psychroflexus torquis ATCC 700755]